jgi:hypothetical protein
MHRQRRQAKPLTAMRIAVSGGNEHRLQIHHVGGLAGGLGAGLRGNTDIGLGACRGVVDAVAAHGKQAAALLLAPITSPQNRQWSAVSC